MTANQAHRVHVVELFASSNALARLSAGQADDLADLDCDAVSRLRMVALHLIVYVHAFSDLADRIDRR